MVMLMIGIGVAVNRAAEILERRCGDGISPCDVLIQEIEANRALIDDGGDMAIVLMAYLVQMLSPQEAQGPEVSCGFVADLPLTA